MLQQPRCVSRVLCDQVWVRDCLVANTGGNGIDLSGMDSGVTGCTVRDLGCIGLRVGGGNTTTLDRGNNVVHGNTVARNARWKRTYMPNLQFGGVGNNYTANNLSDAPHSGIFGGGNAAPWGDPPVSVSLSLSLSLSLSPAARHDADFSAC